MYNTGNPVPSAALEDMADNAQVFDNFVNSSSTTTPNRNGASVKTRAGFEADHDAQITTHEAEHNAQMQSFEDDFDSRLAGMAFTRVGTFTGGYTLTDMRQTLLWEVSQGGDGREYGWTGSFLPAGKVVAAGSSPTPVSAGNWVDRSQDTIRSELNIIVKTFNDVESMVADSSLVVGMFVNTLSYHGGWGASTSKPVGGNTYEIVSSGTGTVDDGSFIALSNGLHAKGLFLDGVTVEMFGAKPNDSTFDSTTAFNNAIEFVRTNASVSIISADADMYRIDGTIDIVSRANRPINNLHLLGAGRTKLKRFSVAANNNTIVAISGQLNRFIGFELTGEVANQFTASGAYAASGIGFDLKGYPQTWNGDTVLSTVDCVFGFLVTDVRHAVRIGNSTVDGAGPDTHNNVFQYLWITGGDIGWSMDGANQLNNQILNFTCVACKRHAHIINGELTFLSGYLGGVADREKGIVQPESSTRIYLYEGRVVGHNFRVEDNTEIHAKLIDVPNGVAQRVVEFSGNVQISSKNGDTEYPIITMAGNGTDQLVMHAVSSCNGYISLDNVNVCITGCTGFKGTGVGVYRGVLESAAQKGDAVNKIMQYKHMDGSVNTILHPTQQIRGYTRGLNKAWNELYNGTDQSTEGSKVFSVETITGDNCRVVLGSGGFDIRSTTVGSSQIGRLSGPVVLLSSTEPDAVSSAGPILFGSGNSIKVKFPNGTVGTLSYT